MVNSRTENLRKEIDKSKRREIKKAAKILFFEKGYKNVSVNAIMKSLNSSTANLYRHYESKDDLFLDLCVDSLKPLVEKMEGIACEPFPAPFRLENLAEMLVQTYHTNPLAMVHLLKKLASPWGEQISNQSGTELKILSNRIIDCIAAVISEGMVQGTLKSESAVQTADIVWGAFTGVVLSFGGRRESPATELCVKRVLTTTFDVIFRGLRVAETARPPDTAEFLPVYDGCVSL